mgnify:CR=1 FL=1
MIIYILKKLKIKNLLGVSIDIIFKKMIIGIPKYTDKNKYETIQELLLDMPVKEHYRMVRESYFNPERNTAKSKSVDFFFPPKISDEDEVVGKYCLDYEREKSLKDLTEKEIKYLTDCQEFIMEQSTLPTEGEIKIAEEIGLKNCENLTPAQQYLYSKFKSRFYTDPRNTGFWEKNHKTGESRWKEIMMFNSNCVSVSNPYKNIKSEEDQASVYNMLHHYFLPKTVERILEILDIYSDDTIPNPDITRESYEVVIAIAHCFKVSTIRDFDTVRDIAGSSALCDIEDVDREMENIIASHGCCLTLLEEEDDETGTGDYYNKIDNYSVSMVTDEKKGTSIFMHQTPIDRELFAIETMSRYNKFGFTINASIHFNFEDEDDYNIIDSLDETYARYCKFHLGI